MTITRLSSERFYLNSSIMGELHDLDWLKQHVDDDEEIFFSDVTDEIAILAVSGPLARDVLQPLTTTDLSNNSFPWLTGQEINIASVPCIALRVSYVGELGWELYIKTNEAKEIYNLIVKTGKEFNLSHCGMFAMDTMRMENGYLHWGHDMSPEENQYQAGLQFAISYKTVSYTHLTLPTNREV